MKVNKFNEAPETNRVILNWSGGASSAVACFLASQVYGNTHCAFCDTHLEHPDTYRFMKDFEKRTGIKVHVYSSTAFHEPEEVWRRYNGLNFAHGAPCSTDLKREVRVKQIQNVDLDYGQVFGFDASDREQRRAKNMTKNYPEINPIYPLIERGFTKPDVIRYLKHDLGLEPPVVYEHFQNNNCIGDYDSPKGGCVQGGVGYWQKIKTIFPKKYDYMAKIEHELSKKKGEPVTICKDQRKDSKGERLFLKHCDDFPDIKTIDVIEGKQPEGLFECHGFCGTLEDYL